MRPTFLVAFAFTCVLIKTESQITKKRKLRVRVRRQTIGAETGVGQIYDLAIIGGGVNGCGWRKCAMAIPCFSARQGSGVGDLVLVHQA